MRMQAQRTVGIQVQGRNAQMQKPPPFQQRGPLASPNIIKSLSGYDDLRKDSRYREMFETFDAIEFAKQEYHKNKRLVLDSLASRYSARYPAQKGEYLKFFLYFADKIAPSFNDQEMLNRYIDILHRIRSHEESMISPTLDVLSNIMSHPKFKPGMIFKMQEIAENAQSGINIFMDLRIFHNCMPGGVCFSDEMKDRFLDSSANFLAAHRTTLELANQDNNSNVAVKYKLVNDFRKMIVELVKELKELGARI